jgi:hypothetical protein
MNYVVVILGIIVIILIYVLYLFFNSSGSTLQAQANLSKDNPAITSIQAPTNINYSYGIWVYINNWDNISRKTIFSRQNNLAVYLDKNTNTLYCDIYMGNASVHTLKITDNFPIQKWVYIIVSFDSGFVDCYLDGKLVKSQKVIVGANNVLPAQPPDGATSIYLGNYSGMQPASQTGQNDGFNANVAKFKRWTNSMDPQTAWTSYMGGNGQSNYFSAFGATIQINKDNLLYGNVPLF